MGMDVSVEVGHLSDGAAMAGSETNDHTVNSMEQLYSPIEIRKLKKGPPVSTILSEFLTPTESVDASKSRQNLLADDEDGYFGGSDSGQVGPTRNELDPYFSEILALSVDGSDWIANNDFQMMVNDGVATGGGKDLNIRKTEKREDISKVLVSAFRGPLILSGYGFDIADRPAPYVGHDDVFRFDPEVVDNRKIWKTGPINLQWDDERMVWQGGHQILCGVVVGEIKAPLSPCHPETFEVKVFRKGNSDTEFYNKISACELDTKITVTNRDPSLQQEAVKGMIFCVAVRINYEWIALWVGCPEGPAPVCAEDDETPTEGYPECVNCDCIDDPQHGKGASM
jgi:hypothetical protein